MAREMARQEGARNLRFADLRRAVAAREIEIPARHHESRTVRSEPAALLPLEPKIEDRERDAPSLGFVADRANEILEQREISGIGAADDDDLAHPVLTVTARPGSKSKLCTALGTKG